VIDKPTDSKNYNGRIIQCNIVIYYTEEFAKLHRIIRYSVNEVAYNEGLISRNVGFVISREHCNTRQLSKGDFFKIIHYNVCNMEPTENPE